MQSQTVLIEKKKKITESINLHNRLGSALWRLPTEVLSEIFIHCLPETSHPTSALAPMLLTVICRRWREVAMDMPNLWCRLLLKVCGDWQRKVLCYDSWLKRSRGLPLSLVFHCYAHNSTWLVRNLLRPYINEIVSLAVFAVRLIDKPERMAAYLPALQELTLSTVGCGLPVPTTGHSFSPNLRSLTVIGPLFDLGIISSFNPVWSHLTHVNLAMRHLNAFFHLLHLCFALSSSKICIIHNRTQALEPFTHAKLQALHINSGTNCLPDLFNALSLPDLRILNVSYSQTWHHKEFMAFLMRSNCPLERIFGLGVTMTDEQRAECVALIPSLQTV
ncbi:hypothetical protein DEU56DRAFT_271090 [Suillus clintonianus]|uniref:uncharacterized protein n=1 Tax=Suillus clintonianus TaxID=1904413 RepID=UPI001B882565|nr:uncharacterized protein DEU56DRAFT_271090 [Suillus clintonianus]KAG2141929.1 hypothetical protein DEU56DRAFT_271090 [Suillus clintonianus]